MASKALIDLGDMTESAERMRTEGEYDSLDEVVQDALRALAREREAFDAHIDRLIEEALADPDPGLPIDEAFVDIRQRIAQRRAA